MLSLNLDSSFSIMYKVLVILEIYWRYTGDILEALLRSLWVDSGF